MPEIDDARFENWREFLSHTSFAVALRNLNEYIPSHRFPPVVADIVKRDPEVFTDYNKLRLDTQTYLQQREEWQRLAINCPPQYSRKHLTSGGQEDV